MTLKEAVETGTSGYVVVPLPEWRQALVTARPVDELQTQTIAELKAGALKAGNVPEVGVRRDQARMVLDLQPKAKPEKLPGDKS